MNCIYDVFGSLTLIISECVLSHGSLRLDINKSRPVCLHQESVYEAVMINLTVKYTAISSCLDFFFSSARRKWPRTRKSNRCGWSQWSVCLCTVCVCCTWKERRLLNYWVTLLCKCPSVGRDGPAVPCACVPYVHCSTLRRCIHCPSPPTSACDTQRSTQHTRTHMYLRA